MKVASKPPPYCAGCFQQKSEKVHVDFEAFYDGPNMDMPEVGPGIKMALDDLILCEDCVAHAARIIGWVEGTAIKNENNELGEALEKANEHIQNLQDTVSGLREANSKLMDEKFGKPKRVSVRRGAKVA